MRIVNSKKVNIPIRIASVMLCLVLFSLYMTSGMLAKYTTGRGADTKARVAKFDVGVYDSDLNLKPVAATTGEGEGAASPTPKSIVFNCPATQNDNGDYEIYVENDSEVAVYYTVVLKLDEAKPDYLTVNTVTGSGESEELGNVTWIDDYTATIQEKATLAPNNTGATECIRFDIDFDGFGLEEGNGTFKVEKDIDFTTIVTFVQID